MSDERIMPTVPEPRATSRVAIVVVTYNGAPWVDALAASIRTSRCPATPFVIDNASTDDTASRLTDWPEARITYLPKNIGFGAANNRGIEQALDQGFDFVFLINQDARLAPDTIGHLVAAATVNPRLAILCPMHLNYTGDALESTFASYLTRQAPTFISDLWFNRVADVVPVKFMPASLWLVRAEALRQVGGFDPLYFLYREDDDLARRMIGTGWGIGLVPAAVAFHEHGQPKRDATGAPTWLAHRTEVRSLFVLNHPRFSRLYALLHATRDVVLDALHAAAYGRFRIAAAILWGYTRALIRLPRLARSRAERAAVSPFLRLATSRAQPSRSGEVSLRPAA